MAQRPRPTLMDYMVIAISPLLIMTLVGSLLFFLLTVFYHGQYEARLMFIFALFVMAIVLIARISMEEGIEYASLFAIPLAVVTGLALLRFVRLEGAWAFYGTLVNFGLMALVWWSSHKLTWDCTLIDENRDSSEEGLLQAVGLAHDVDDDQHGLAAAPAPGEVAESPQTLARPELPVWWQRMVDRRRRPHTPGVWVICYSLVALGLFGVGQWFIPVADTAGRLRAFHLMFVYVFSALGLLLTTSFLGLRRYLRQRHLQMPADMAGMWLGIGSIMILVLLLVSVFLPRPGAELKMSQIPISIGSPDHRRTHQQAPGRDGPQRPDQATRTRRDAQESSPGRNMPGGGEPSDVPTRDDSSAPSRAQQSRAGSRQSATPRQSREVSPSQREEAGQRDASDASPLAADRAASSERSPEPSDGNQSRPKTPSGSVPRAPQNAVKAPRSADGPDGTRSAEPARKQADAPPSVSSSDRSAEGKGQPGKSRLEPRSGQPTFLSRVRSHVVGGFANILKLLFWAALICVGTYFGWKHRDRIREAIRLLIGDVRNLLARLLGWRRAREQMDDGAPAPPAAGRLRPFSSYADPFLSGQAQRYTTEQLVRYSFEALEAWARERSCPRADDQTPLEFARALAVEHPGLGMEAQSLADLYSRVAYGHQRLAAQRRGVLETLWRHMSSTATMPLPP